MSETYWKLAGLCALGGLVTWTVSGYNALVLAIGLLLSIGLPFVVAFAIQAADKKAAQNGQKLSETQIKLLANSTYKLEDKPPLKVKIRPRIKL